MDSISYTVVNYKQEIFPAFIQAVVYNTSISGVRNCKALFNAQAHFLSARYAYNNQQKHNNDENPALFQRECQVLFCQKIKKSAFVYLSV